MVKIFLFLVLFCGFFGCTSEDVKLEPKKEVVPVAEKKASSTKAKISSLQAEQVRAFINEVHGLNLKTRLDTLQLKMVELDSKIQEAKEKIERIDKFLKEKPPKQIESSLFAEELNQTQNRLEWDQNLIKILKKDETQSLFLQENQERVIENHEALLANPVQSAENKEKVGFCQKYLKELQSSELVKLSEEEEAILKSFYQEFIDS